ncbi:MAG: hypothetical protein K0S34_2257 [Bacillales bacterium]|nr:hypothetical protein [Bacillales bacterium]
MLLAPWIPLSVLSIFALTIFMLQLIIQGLTEPIHIDAKSTEVTSHEVNIQKANM